MCGIFGHTGKYSSSFNKDKFNILGIYNESRGKQSAGFSINGEIYLSSTGSHLWSEFIQEHYDTFKQKPELIKSVIGHTRQASKGGISELNTHPFGFDTLIIKGTPICKFIGEHNGSLYNEDDLVEEYGIKEKKTVVNSYGNTIQHSKIDSEILLEILYTSQNFEVLSKYYGGAALAWIDCTKPNTLYLFHGKSKKQKYSSTEEEERPLFVWKETKNSLYFSSLKEGLLAIGANPNNVIELPHNIVFEITDGNYDKSKQYVIDRSNVGQFYNTTTVNTVTTYKDPYSYNSHYADFYDLPRRHNLPIVTTPKKKPEKVLSIFTEKYPELDSNGRVIYNKLRYKVNGHNITGIYTVTSEGLLYLGSTNIGLNKFKEKYNHSYYSFKNKEFSKDYKAGFVNISIFDEKSLLYIYDGILLKTSEDYEACHKLYANFSHVPYKEIAFASVYPVAQSINSNKQGKKVRYSSDVFFTHSVTTDPYKFTGNFSPIGTKSIYYFKNGILDNITKYSYFNQMLREPSYTIPEVIKNNFTETIKKNTCDVDCIDDSSNYDDELLEMVNIFNTQVMATMEYIDNLSETNEKIDKFKDILDDLDNALNEFVIENLNEVIEDDL